VTLDGVALTLPGITVTMGGVAVTPYRIAVTPPHATVTRDRACAGSLKMMLLRFVLRCWFKILIQMFSQTGHATRTTEL
jgi:hypothetical protein